MDERHTCCFTGHRPDKLPWGTREEDPRCVALKGRIAAALEEEYAGGPICTSPRRCWRCGRAAPG